MNSCKFVLNSIAIATFFGATTFATANQPDWSENASIEATGRSNPYSFPESELNSHIQAGRLHAVVYPVNVTGVLVPYQPLVNFFSNNDNNPLRWLLNSLFKNLSRFKTMDQMYEWLGLNHFPATSDEGIYAVPYPNETRPDYRMGVTLIDTPNGTGLTFGCAACHAGSLFGKTVLGLTNKAPRANEFFILGKKGLNAAPRGMFQFSTKASDDEMKIFDRAKYNLQFIGARAPSMRGLDTSLAHTAISLAHRAPDAEGTKDIRYARSPRFEPLTDFVADSKPMVWWNVKYKNRWLSDGSVVSGNPIFTNILWNEIGRGTELADVENWLAFNSDIVSNLTTAVFSSKAPRYTDFFPAESIDLVSAKRGEGLFNQSCARCHGSYQKAWHSVSADTPLSEQFETLQVRYHERTPVINVGTDAQRHRGMESLAPALNRLRVSQVNNIVVKQQHGYVPPPLVGIWARWPYFHNNSVANLCELLTSAAERSKVFYISDAIDPNIDYDNQCNGLPVGAKTPAGWKNEEWRRFDTTRPGLSNRGHDEGIFLDRGVEIFSARDKSDLIQFLKTL